MNNYANEIAAIVGQNTFTAYLFIYVGTIFFGNVASFASFWLAYAGVFGKYGVLSMLGMMLFADITGDILWYSLGRALRDTRPGNWVKGKLPRPMQKFEEYVEHHQTRLVALSKFIMGSSFFIMVSVGWARMDFNAFLRTTARSIVVWAVILLALSYGLFSAFNLVGAKTVFHKLEVMLGAGIAAFLLLDFLISYGVRKFFKTPDEEGER